MSEIKDSKSIAKAAASAKTELSSEAALSKQVDFNRLLAEHLQRDAEILRAVKDIKRYIHRQQIWSTLRFLLIIIPIILGFIYLPPFIKQAMSTLGGFYNGLNF